MDKSSSPILLTQKNVPIPSDIPKPPDLSSLPSHILRSSAVESLITQNDDLMARLSVSLRRISLLEEKINSYNQKNEKMQRYFENLKDQILILKEKEIHFSSRRENLENQYKKMEEDFKLLKIRYGELFSTQKEKEQDWLQSLKALSLRLERYMKYRKNLNRSWKSKRVKFQNLEKEKKDLLLQLAKTKVFEQSLEKQVQEQRKRIEKQDQIAKENLGSLMAIHDKKVSALKKDLGEKEKAILDLEEKNKDMEKVYNENVDVKNHLVFVKRKREEVENQLHSQIESFKKEAKHYRSEFRKLKLKVEDIEPRVSEAESLLEKEKEVNLKLQSQVENLQILWKEGQEQIEKKEEQNRTLKNLNQKLSLDMKAYRQDLKELKEKL